jgi:hypothetical protein
MTSLYPFVPNEKAMAIVIRRVQVNDIHSLDSWLVFYRSLTLFVSHILKAQTFQLQAINVKYIHKFRD